jgi:hypothetical protein
VGGWVPLSIGILWGGASSVPTNVQQQPHQWLDDRSVFQRVVSQHSAAGVAYTAEAARNVSRVVYHGARTEDYGGLEQ